MSTLASHREISEFLQFKVSLTGPDTEYLCDIWRRIVVPKNITLLELHAIIQGAMGWEDRHLHEFFIEGKRYLVPDKDFPDEQVLDDDLDERDKLVEHVIQRIEEFYYLYDFGDGWRHLIEVEDMVSLPSRVKLLGWPICIDGQGACPPEDCGGPYGYANLLKALGDPEHEEHSNLLGFHGSRDPYAFNTAQANSLIGMICALYRERGEI